MRGQEKMAKKKKSENGVSSEARTCFTFAAAFAVIGIILIIVGKNWYHTKDMVSEDEIQMGEAVVVSVDKVSRNLSPSDKKLEEDKGYTGDELRYEYSVTYQVNVDGTDYTYGDTRRYYNNGSHEPKVGDTDTITYAVKDGEFIAHPETQGTNQFTIGGGFLIVLAVIALAIGFFIRK